MEAQLLHIQPVDVLAACERENDESRGNALGDHARKRHAVGRHAEADDEHEVEDNVQHACGGEVDERRFRVADGTQNAAAVVVERGGGHAEEVNAQVELGAVDEVLARVEKLKERTGKDKPEREHQKACDQAHEERRVDGLAHILFVARAEVRGDEHVGAAAKTHQKAREQENERCGRADRAHGGRAGKTPDNSKVDHAEEHLQKVGKHQRQGKANDLTAEAALRHIERGGMRHKMIPLSFLCQSLILIAHFPLLCK